MSSTALPEKPVERRKVNLDSIPSTTSSSTAGTPLDSPTASASSTSLSSLGSVEEFQKEPKPDLLDGYGNEFKLPDYTIKEIRDAIPKHCFERSGLRGLGYVARDIACLATVFYIFNTYCTPQYVPSYPLRGLLWAVYAFVQGLFGTGLWVLAHECGHQSFSPSKTLNDTVGWVLHSALLVPYFSWKISHGKHHKATGHMERDMVFTPRTREEHATRRGYLMHEMHELLEDAPLYSAVMLVGQQLIGWPWYLVANVTGHDFHHKQVEGKGAGRKNGDFSVNHFNPKSPLYEKKDEYLILLSDLGIFITCSVLFAIGRTFGWTNLLVWYGLPYAWVNHWLVAITYLQHTDPSLPHYNPESWNFARGAAATIDREFGFIGRQLFHGIIETHVLHHYVSTIPFYHADEASEAIRPVMGQHYRSNTEGGPIGFIKSLWSSMRWCQWVEPNEGAKGENSDVLFFRNRNGLGPAPAQMPAPEEKTVRGTGMTVEVEDDS